MKKRYKKVEAYNRFGLIAKINNKEYMMLDDTIMITDNTAITKCAEYVGKDEISFNIYLLIEEMKNGKLERTIKEIE